MKTICDTVKETVLSYQQGQAFNSRVCTEYEKANSIFEKLVEKGAAEKRGYCLLSLENKVSYQTKVNN